MQAPFLNRRTFLGTSAALGASLALPAMAQRAGGTTRRILVGFPAGGTADSLARALGPLLANDSAHYVIENRSGATGQLAADAVRQAPADGNTLLLTPSSVLTLAPLLYQKPLYDTQRDFAPVACVCDHSFALAVKGDSPIRDLAGFIAHVKANPGGVTYATPGPGSAPHFLGVKLEQEIGQPMVHVPYRGVAPGLQDLMGGQVASTLNPLPTMLEFHRAGRIRILAVSNPTRLASLPDVPTFTEAGHPGLELVEWYGLFAGSQLPAATAAELAGQVRQALDTAAMREAAQRLEVVLRYEDGPGLERLVQGDMARWQPLVAQTGIKLD